MWNYTFLFMLMTSSLVVMIRSLSVYLRSIFITSFTWRIWGFKLFGVLRVCLYETKTLSWKYFGWSFFCSSDAGFDQTKSSVSLCTLQETPRNIQKNPLETDISSGFLTDWSVWSRASEMEIASEIHRYFQRIFDGFPVIIFLTDDQNPVIY